ncbi:hypothetical protein KKH82_03970 [Patescibacteria group bacterium]|nr:hypothetical protein [Patescibacteria group bacterium]
MRFFDSNLASRVISLFVKETPTIMELTGDTLSTPVFETLTTLDTEIDIIAEKLVGIKAQEAKITSSQLISTSAPTVVKLYYFNEQEDKKLPVEQQASPESLVPVIRTVPQTDNIIRDAISLLLQ